MITLIACGIVIVLISAISEFRLLEKEKENIILRELVKERNETLLEISKVGNDLVNDYMILFDILVDHFGVEKVNDMFMAKKSNINNKKHSLNDFLKKAMKGDKDEE